MYPYYSRFDERRRDTDENRFWFWNSMHFPVPHPAFDVICIDSPYQAVGAWQNRVFAVPPAMGIDYRVVNGYVYISGNPVTDPEKIAERAGYFQKRAGHYYENWAELYGKWKAKMQALIADLDALVVPELPDYEALPISVDDAEVGDDAVEEQLSGLRDRFATLAGVERPAEAMIAQHIEKVKSPQGAQNYHKRGCRGAKERDCEICARPRRRFFAAQNSVC